MNSMYKFTIKDPVYRATIECYVGDGNDYNKALKKIDTDDKGINICACGCTSRITSEKGYIWYHLWLREWNKKLESTKILLHECVHLTSKIFNDRGIREIKDADESRAYYTEFLFEAISNKLNGILKRTKRNRI